MAAIERSMLEGICAYVDEQFKEGQDVSTSDVLLRFNIDENDGPALPKYFAFTQQYIALSEEHHTRQERLISPPIKMDLERIFRNSVVGGLAGSLVSYKPIGGIVGAAAGCALTLYDETKRMGMNLSSSFMGVLFGGLVGSMVYKPLGLLGAAIGGSIGLSKAGVDAYARYKERKRETTQKLRALDDEKASARMALYQQTLPNLLESKNTETVPTLEEKIISRSLTNK